MSETVSITPAIRRLRAANPSPLTGTGTNTYLIGTTDLAIIDPGPDDDAHLSAILAALGPRQRICTILVTHAHRDHSALVPRLANATGAEVLAFGTAMDGLSPQPDAFSGTLGPTGEGLDLAFVPDRRLADGDKVFGPDWEVQALHTPGHLGGHLCLAVGSLLFSGDHVMGWSTSIVSPPEGDMGDYIASLRRLQKHPWHRLLPGHGAPVEAPAHRIAELLAHRLKREAQILAALADAPATPATLTARIYLDTPKHLWLAAERNVLAHLLDLLRKNRVSADPFPGQTAQFRLL